MKKTKMLAVLLAMTLALASCGQGEEKPGENIEEQKPDEKPEEKPEETPEEKPEETPEEKPEEGDISGEGEGANQLEIVDLEEVDIRTLNTQSDLRQIAFGIYTEAEKTGADEFVESLKKSHAFAKLTEENMENYLGAKYDFEEGLVSESMIGTRAYSMILIRAKNENDAEKLEKQIMKSVDPAKWICVQAESIDGDTNDNLLLVIMGEKKENKIMLEAFDEIEDLD